MKKITTLVLLVAVLFCISCNKESNTPNKKVIVLTVASESNARWAQDIAYLKEALGRYDDIEVTVKTANETNGAATQLQQIKDAIADGYKNFIITPIDYSLINESKVFDGKDLNIVCQDRMILNNANVDYYSSCDGYEIGQIQAQYLLQAFSASSKETMTIEILAGPSYDKNAALFYNGAFDYLKSPIDKGDLIIGSGKKNYADVAVASWEEKDAEAAMLSILNTYYPGGTVPDLILAPNDNFALGIVRAIGIHNPSLAKYPVITGQDNTTVVAPYIRNGKVSMTIDKSIRDMSYNSAMIIVNLLNGVKPATPYTFNNGLIDVPFFKANPKVITINNLD